MSSMPEPFDPTYTATNFVGFSLSVDIISDDRTLGANWQSISMGSMSLGAQDLQPGGYSRTRFQVIGDLTYGNITLTRPWTPSQSGWIPQWFSAAANMGASAVSIAINYLDVKGNLQQAIYNFRDAYPVSWTQPDFSAGSGAEFSTESLTFSHSGFATSDNLTPGVDQPESVEPFRLVVLPGGISAMSSALSTMTSWTAAGDMAAYSATSVLADAEAVQSQGASLMAGALPAITFWVPPSSISVSKSAGWGVNPSPDAIGSGPVNWLGTNPLTIEFDYILDSTSSDARQGGLSEVNTVLPDVERLLALLEVDPLMAVLGTGTAPMVMVLWGDFTSPVSYVENVTAEFTQFDGSGRPIRATGHIAITQYPSAALPTNPTSGGDLPRRSQEVYAGDQLAHVAFRSYKNPAYWRDLATVNGITDPLRIKAGVRLLVPDRAALPRRGDSGRPMGPIPNPSSPRGARRKGGT